MTAEENAKLVADAIACVSVDCVNHDFGTLDECIQEYGKEAGRVMWAFAVLGLAMGIVNKIL